MKKWRGNETRRRKAHDSKAKSAAVLVQILVIVNGLSQRVHIGGPSRWFFFLSFFLYFSARASRGARYLKISARKRRRKGNTGKTEQNLTTRINEKMLSIATTIIHRNNCTLASIHPRLLQSPCPGRFPCLTSLELVIILRVRIAISFLLFLSVLAFDFLLFDFFHFFHFL